MDIANLIFLLVYCDKGGQYAKHLYLSDLLQSSLRSKEDFSVTSGEVKHLKTKPALVQYFK